jgi:hypothetical protein
MGISLGSYTPRGISLGSYTPRGISAYIVHTLYLISERTILRQYLVRHLVMTNVTNLPTCARQGHKRLEADG